MVSLKKNILRKRIVSGVFVLIFFVNAFVTVPRAHAQMWGTADIFGDFVLNMLQKIERQIEGALLMSLKATAAQLLNSQVASLIGGSSVGGSAVISDWKSWLRDEPEKKVAAAREEFFNSVLRGRDSSSYHDMLANQDAGVNNYYEMLAEQMEGFDSSGGVYANAEELVGGDPVVELASGNIKALNALFAKPTNNPFGLALVYESEMQTVRENAKTEQMVKSMSSGYKGVEKDGKTILPGSTVGAIVADSQDIGNKIIAAASNPGELAGGVIVSMVNKTITNMIKKGVGDVQANIQREIKAVDKQISREFRDINKELGPAAKYLKEVKQQTKVIPKPATNPGAAIPQSYDP